MRPTTTHPGATASRGTLFVVTIALLALVVSAFLPGVALARKKPLHDIPLVWKPTDEIGDLGTVDLTGLGGVEVRVLPFTDDRDDPERIGENVEDADEGVVLSVTTSDEVGPWVADHFAWAIDQFGIDTTDEGGTVVLEGEVKRFFVVEEHTYESDVGVRVTLKGTDGTVLWEGVANGAATRFGRSYKVDNYYEVLSDAVLQAVFKLLENDAFRDALAAR